MKNRSHRGDLPPLCVATPAELAEASVEQYDLLRRCCPLSTARSTFWTMRPSRCPTGATRAQRGDHVDRLRRRARAPPELIDLFIDHAARSDDGALDVFELMLTHLGAARASEVATGHVRVRRASTRASRRPSASWWATELRPYLSLYQVWRVGTSNVPRTYETTPWSGTYGAGFDRAPRGHRHPRVGGDGGQAVRLF